MTILNSIFNKNNLDKEYLDILNDLSQKTKVVVTGLSLPYKSLLAGVIPNKILFVMNDAIEARHVKEQFESMGISTGLLVEKYDVLTFQTTATSSQIADRINAIYDLALGRKKVIITTPEALMQYYPKKSLIEKCYLNLQVNNEYQFSFLTETLMKMGYNRLDNIESRGDYSIKGDIIEIFLSTMDNPIRIIFFDEQIESINEISLETKQNLEQLDSVEILANSDVLAPTDVLQKALATYEKCIEKATKKDRYNEILTSLSLKLNARNVDFSYQYLVPFMIDNMSGMEDFADDYTLWLDECRVIHDRAKLIYTEFKSRVAGLVEGGEVVDTHIKAYRKAEVVIERLLLKCKTIATMAPQTINPFFYEYKLYSLKSTPIPLYYMDRELLIRNLKNYAITRYGIVVCCRDISRAKVFCESLEQDDIASSIEINEKSNVDLQKLSSVIVTDLGIRNGFVMHKEKIVVIGTNELMRPSINKTSSKKKRNVFTIPEAGDFVVHEIHGVGLCEGISRLKSGNSYKDYITVKYKGGDKLYIPVENMDSISRYSGKDSDPPISKMGGKEFLRAKEKVKGSVKKLAFDLLELYAKRSKLQGYKYPPDTQWQLEFEEMFPYAPTYDQLRSTEEIKDDLEQGKLMDRLLCGDVGFGKTEVAQRAAFKVAVEGKQVAFIAPTTILAMQHYNTIKERFEHFGLRVALLCRFKTNQEIKKSIQEIKEGLIDVVVGTHRVLSKDVVFKDLGLLILDEEQRFGVQHKEQIQYIRSSVNVLSLSATPIPRTLNMALTGVRDISLLETPPEERLPIQTIVTTYNDNLIVDAINREIARGGQVFILYNRVDRIYKFATEIANMVEDAKVIVAHGQMQSVDLENSIARFYNKDANVLVCTTIIQNGIDLPDANTLIVIDADRLGLSELYQLRGRVGRSNKLAYAYFTVKEGDITENAEKRLKALMEYTEFGSGFRIAMCDLEIRGAGNILGREQSGFVSKIGYDMYCSLLEDAVQELSGEKKETRVSTEMSVDADYYIDDDIADKVGGKMRLYRRIADVASEQDRANLIASLTKVVHNLPQNVCNLIDVAFIKSLASEMGIKRVIVTPTSTMFVFESNQCFSNKELMDKVNRRSKFVKFALGESISLIFDLKNYTVRERLDYLINFFLN